MQWYETLDCHEGEKCVALIPNITYCNRLLLHSSEAYNNRQHSLFFVQEENLSKEHLPSPKKWLHTPFQLTDKYFWPWPTGAPSPVFHAPCSLVLIQGCSVGPTFHHKWEYGVTNPPPPPYSESRGFHKHPDEHISILGQGDEEPNW